MWPGPPASCVWCWGCSHAGAEPVTCRNDPCLPVLPCCQAHDMRRYVSAAVFPRSHEPAREQKRAHMWRDGRHGQTGEAAGVFTERDDPHWQRAQEAMADLVNVVTCAGLSRRMKAICIVMASGVRSRQSYASDTRLYLRQPGWRDCRGSSSGRAGEI